MAKYSIKEMADRLTMIRSACDPNKNQFLWDRLTEFADELRAIAAEWRPISEKPEISDAMVSAGLNGWFSVQPSASESDAVLERSMAAALKAAIALIPDVAQSQQGPLWHRVQDQIDAWAQETLGEDAGVIMSWSDRLAQHLAPELAAQPPAAPVERETCPTCGRTCHPLEKPCPDRWHSIHPAYQRSSAANESLAAVRRYVEMRDAQPLKGLDETIHAIHTGTEFAAELRLPDLRATLSLITDAPQPPSIPAEPTKEMALAGRKALAAVADRMEEAKLLATSSVDFWQRVGHEPANEIYTAMVSVALSRPQQPPSQTIGSYIDDNTEDR